jgi:thymidylate synthase
VLFPLRFSPTVLPDLRAGYREVARSVLHGGRRREARGFVAFDVADATFTVENTRRVLPLGARPEIRPAIGYAEALLLCAGVESPSLLESVSGSFRRFMDGGALAGSYGPLMRPQMEYVVSALKRDHDSRQAIVQVHPGAHNTAGLRDVPCTLNLGFELRSDGIHMRSTMRSNDVWLGLTYDAFQFCQLGWTVANIFDVPLVSYTHHAYSLHVYERDVGRVEEMLALDVEEYDDEPTGFGKWAWTSYEAKRRRAEMIYERVIPENVSGSERDYLETLQLYDRQIRTQGFAT